MKSILSRRWLAIACIALMGSTGLYLTRAGDSPKQSPPETNQRYTLASTIELLDTPVVLEAGTKGVTTDLLMTTLSLQKKIIIRVDAAWFRQTGQPDLENISEKQLTYDMPKGLTLRESLDEFCRNLQFRAEDGTRVRPGYKMTAGHILIGAGFETPSLELISGSINAQHQALAQHFGPSVSLAVKDKTLAEIISQLREQTGANIVMLPSDAKLDTKITLTLHDVKLLTALNLAAEFCDLAAASSENVFRITTPTKADKINGLAIRASQGDFQDVVNVPVDKDGKFVPPADTGNFVGCMGLSTYPRLVPYTVEKPAPKK